MPFQNACSGGVLRFYLLCFIWLNRLRADSLLLCFAAVFIFAANAQADPNDPVYYVKVIRFDVVHTRAHTTDTIYVSLLGTNTFTLPPSKSDCHEPFGPDFQSCVTVKVGNVQKGVHTLDAKDAQSIGPFSIGPDGALNFGIAVWNYGFGVKTGTGDLTDALYDALKPALGKLSDYDSLGWQYFDLDPSLNHHKWSGCDGPVFGWGMRISAAGLARMFVDGSASPGEQTIGPVTVRSQVGCGASSQYAVDFQITQVGTPR